MASSPPLHQLNKAVSSVRAMQLNLQVKAFIIHACKATSQHGLIKDSRIPRFS